MTAVVQDKDTYDIIKNTIAPGIIKETKILQASQVLEVAVYDAVGGNVVDRCICLIDKDVTAELLSMGNSTLNSDQANSDDVTSITIEFNEESRTFDLYRAILSSVVTASCSIEYITHPIYTVCTGDLVFLATMFGKDGMSSHWCPYCQMTKQNWSDIRPEAALVKENLWTDELMTEKRLEYIAAKATNRSLNGILGVNNNKLWPYSVNDMIPPVLHIPLGLIQNLWDHTETYITSVSNVSEEERDARIRLILLTDEEIANKEQQRSGTERLKDLTIELKSLQKDHNNLTFGTHEYRNSLDYMNETAILKEELVKHIETSKKLKDMTSEDKKKHTKLLEEFERNRTFFEDTCHQSTKDVLASYRIYRQAYMSRCFIGPHARKMMLNADDIMMKIAGRLKANCHADVSHAEIDKKCTSITSILKVLNSISSYTKRTKPLTDNDIDVLDLKVGELSTLWRQHGMNVTPKFHILECHIVDAMKKHRVLGLFSEEAIERTHHEAKVLQGKANDNDFAASQQFIETRRRMGQSAEVIKTKSIMNDGRKRKFGVHSCEKKRLKEEIKAEKKLISYSTPIINLLN